MVDAIDRFHPYLQTILTSSRDSTHQDWQEFYLPTQAELPLRVQTCLPPQAPSQSREEKREQMDVLAGLRKYASDHVLVVGKPGSGKSTSLRRLCWEEARRCWESEEQENSGTFQIPIFLELRSFQCNSVLQFIQRSLQQRKLRLSEAEIEDLLFDEQLLLLLDGLNELPSGEAWQKVDDFRRDYADVPMIFSTRELGAGADLGIEKKLEMMPLTEPQMRQFIERRLPGQADVLLRQVHDRLRELAETPLLLKMLCDVFAQKEGKIPENRGELFRKEFARRYEEFKPLRGRISEDSRRFAPELLQYLAFTMVQGDPHSDPCKPTASWLTISKTKAEKILETFLVSRVNAPAQAAKEWLEDLLEHHLLQVANDPNQIEFHHQIFQEYYAAEWLLLQLPTLSNEQLQYYFLNYLKWTETIGLMLGLPEVTERQAVKLVKSSLKVDLMLGARLAGEVKEELQEKTIELIDKYQFDNGQRAQDWLKLELFAASRSDAAVPKIKKILEVGDQGIVAIAAEMLGKIGTSAATEALLQALQHEFWNARYGVAEALGEIGSNEAIRGLRMALHDEDLSVACTAVDSLNKIGSPQIVPILVEALRHPSENVTKRAISGLEQFNFPEATKIIKNALQHRHNIVRWKAAWILSERCGEEILPYIVKLSKDPDWQVRRQALEIIEKLKTRKSKRSCQFEDSEQNINKPIDTLIHDFQSEIFNIYWEAYRQLKKASREQAVFQVLPLLEHKDPRVRERSADLLGEIGSPQEVSILISRLNCENNTEVRQEIAFTLGKLGSTAAVHELVEALKHRLRQRRLEAVDILGELQVDETIPYLIQALDDEAEEIRLTIAKILGNLRIEQAVPRLAQALKDTYGGVKINVVIALIRIGSEAAFLHLIDAWRNKKILSHDIACSLEKVESNSSAIALPHLVKMIPDETWNPILQAISNIQSCCKFYNYDIAQSPPSPAVRQDSGAENQGQTTNVYHIDRVGNLNTGNVTIHGNQIGDTSNG